MKKLLVTAIGAAAAFGAFAGTISQQRIGDITATGGKTVAELNTALGNYWSEPAGATNTYTVSDLSSIGQITPPIDPISGKSLDIKTTFGKPLSVDIVEGGTPTNIPSSGLYFDSLVKFTVCEDAPADTYSGAKIIMWLQEAQDGSGNATGTNLVVRAGYLTAPGSVVATNYLCGTAIDGAFADAWHRVTIKAMADMTVDSGLGHIAVPGFAIFIDSDRTVISDDSKWDGDLALTEAAAHYTTAGLFPSMVQDAGNGSKGTLTCASFDGTGSMTDIVFTDNAPIAAAEDYVAPKANVTIGDTTTSYSTLAEAVAAVSSLSDGQTATLQLIKGMTLEEPLTVNAEYGTVIIDFAGNVWTNTLVDAAITNNAAALVITNSVGNGGIYCTDREDGAAIYNDGGLTIYGGTINGLFEIGGNGDNIEIFGGSFLSDNVGSYLADGKSLVENSETGLYDVVDALTTYTVNFMDGEDIIASTNVVEGTRVTEPTAPTKAKYRFDGWTLNGSAYDFSTVVTGDIDLVASWTAVVAQIGQKSYETFAAALAGAVDGDTITLLDSVTEPKFTIPVSTYTNQGLAIDLDGNTYTFEASSGDAIYLLVSNKLTIANGTIAAASGATFRDVIRNYDSDLTLNNVTFDGANFPEADGSKLACLLCVEGGDVDIIGSTSFINVKSKAYAIKMGNHAQAWYEMGTTTVNTTGNIEGNILIAGGVYNEVAVGSGSTINYYYGKNVHSSWEDGVSSANFAARLGTLPTAAGTQDNVSGQLFKTLQAAVDAAQANDTVTVVADSTISTPLSIAKNITVHNDYTITGAVNYAICIGATVSFEGSGKIERASNISGSAFCVGANETTRGAITAGTAGTLNFDGLTVCGGNGGNLIKLENGTVNMNGGVLRDGKRGIKADADVGNFTSAIVINGGTITNNTDCAIMASAASANGTATVVVNGGVIAGALVYDGTAGTYSITIPSTSTAKFNADQSAFCAEGYETTQDSDGWYVVTAVPPPAPSGIDPASATPSADVSAASAEAAIEAVEVEAPAEAGSTSEAKAAYKDLFTYTAVETSAGSGVYTVTLTGIKEEVQEAVSKDAVDVLTSDEATVDVPAGLCYKVTTYTALGGAAVETKSGTSDGTAIPVAKPGTTQGFIKVELATKPLN